jgi:hypothetical protein
MKDTIIGLQKQRFAIFQSLPPEKNFFGAKNDACLPTPDGPPMRRREHGRWSFHNFLAAAGVKKENGCGAGDPQPRLTIREAAAIFTSTYTGFREKIRVAE